MKKNLNHPIITIISLIFFTGCVPQKNIDYLQNPLLDQAKYPLQQKPVSIIKPNDELYINVSSFDDISFNYFEVSQDIGRSGFSNELSVTLMSYAVTENGSIFFPVLGNVKLAGLTIEEAREKMEDELASYFNQPIVSIKFAYKKITVLGEVNTPGHIIYSKNRITIFDALGMAGDLTIHGDRHELLLLRQVQDSIIKSTIDLTDDQLVFSENYYIEPDDVIYVKSRKSRTWSIISVPITLVLTSISTLLLMISYVQRL